MTQDHLDTICLQKSNRLALCYGVPSHVMLEAIDDNLTDDFLLAGLSGMDAGMESMFVLLESQNELLRDLHE